MAMGDYCSPLACDAPMRGGIRLDGRRDNGTFGGCTVGFNVKRADGRPFVLTAGHCVLGKNHENADRIWHNGIRVLNEHVGGRWESVTDRQSSFFGTPITDYAFMPYDADDGNKWEDFWLKKRWGKNRVAEFTNCAIDPRGDIPGFKCDYYNYYMSSAQTPPNKGTWVCSTGAAGPGQTGSGAPADWLPGTRCGEVVQKSWPITKAHICTAPGDSGGPLFNPATSQGIGILHDGDAATGNGKCKGDGDSLYFNLPYTFDKARAKYGYSFSLNTDF
jgi:streptogrisin C